MIVRSLSIALAALLVSGCVQSHRERVVYVPEPAPLAPTSTTPEVRVYSPAGPVVTQPPPSAVTPAIASDPDVVLAQSVSRLLKGEPDLASVSRKVSATVQNGVVTLRGSVPSENDREEIKERVSRLPGVFRVVDELGTELR